MPGGRGLHAPEVVFPPAPRQSDPPSRLVGGRVQAVEVEDDVAATNSQAAVTVVVPKAQPVDSPEATRTPGDLGEAPWPSLR